jgi:hypothetical protein
MAPEAALADELIVYESTVSKYGPVSSMVYSTIMTDVWHSTNRRVHFIGLS